MQEKDYDKSHTKYWPNRQLWDMAINQGVHGGDYGALKFACERQSHVLGGARVSVDLDAGWCEGGISSHVAEVDGLYTRTGAPSYLIELEFLRRLARLRDEPLVSVIDELPKAYWLASTFLKDVQIQCGKEDFLTTEAEINTLHRDAKVPRTYRKEGKVARLGDLNEATLRHWAEYVHADNPVLQWNGVVDQLIRAGCPVRTEVGLQPIMGNSRFGTGGPPFVEGAIGQVLKSLAPLSFRGKWELVIPRPEQWAWQNTDDLLPQVFPEGSPAHPSRDAMHYRAAQVIAYFVSMLFDPYHLIKDSLGNDQPVYHELQLLADNISFARCSAGVHWMSDNNNDESCAQLAEYLMREIMGVEGRVLPAMRELTFAAPMFDTSATETAAA